jgi:hypothetical protein
MRSVAILISISAGILLAILLAFLPLFLSSERWTAAQEKARARRLADAKMNARLLRLDI